MGPLITRRIQVAFVGCPNVGKSTLFNALTGMRQHTGNWPGKTVGMARGRHRRGNTELVITDLPGTYSLRGASRDEQVAARYIAREDWDCVVVVCDAGCLERSLILALQVLEKAKRAVVCLNLMDEAKRRGIWVNHRSLSRQLGVPVVCTAGDDRQGLEELTEVICTAAAQPEREPLPRWENPVFAAEEMAKDCVKKDGKDHDFWRRKIDQLLVSRRFGGGLLCLTLFFIVWLTVWGANYPSELLQRGFNALYGVFHGWLSPAPAWFSGLLLDGVYATCTRVAAVMLPPMAIFFPLFTLLEDVGYLPRMAFLLDPAMARCGGCGKQALTLCMGLGCNAVGVMGCRIIESPRERTAAMLTNAFVPCNGRFPTLIVLGSLFFSQAGAALAVAACVALGVVGAMAVSGVLNRTVLRAQPSSFLMEMPPFRRPRLGKILVRSLVDRTIFITGRAMKVAAPAGALLWLLSYTGLLATIAGWLDPLGLMLGMNGIILLGFILALPANELTIPVILMGLGGSTLQAVGEISPQLLLSAGFTWQMALCTMVFTLYHWPCATTLMTIYRESGSIKKTAAAGILPTAVGVTLCFLLNLLL